MSGATIPIFPLHTVLFPGGPLALRIFEPRYLDMVSRCLREGSGFGVSLIREGQEVGAAALPYEVGTFGHISYWQRRADGLLGITLIGERRFRILSSEVGANLLMTAEVQWLDEAAGPPLRERFGRLAELLKGILEQLEQPYRKIPRHYDDAAWVGARLAELLPLSLAQKQYFLQMEDSVQRLERLQAMLDADELG
jgi:Lon protease-like protein